MISYSSAGCRKHSTAGGHDDLSVLKTTYLWSDSKTKGQVSVPCRTLPIMLLFYLLCYAAMQYYAHVKDLCLRIQYFVIKIRLFY